MSDRRLPTPPPSRVTLKDVAEAARVSLATASRVLNGSAQEVREELAERVRFAAGQLGYKANLAAQAIARGNSGTVAVVVDDIRDRHSAQMARGVIEGAAAAGLVATIAGGRPDSAGQIEALRDLMGLRPAAVIFAAAATTGEDADQLVNALNGFRDAGSGVASIGIHVGDIPSCTLDFNIGARELTAGLAARGYRRPLLVGSAATERGGSDITSALREALAMSAIPAVAELDVDVTTGIAGGYQAINTLPNSFLKTVDLIVCADDSLAVGVLSGLRSRNSAPIGLTGFHDLVLATDTDPPLTTVRVPLQDAGEIALSIALAVSTSTILSTKAVGTAEGLGDS